MKFWNPWKRPASPENDHESLGGGSLLRDEGGATFVEYITIIVVVLVASISVFALWRQAVKHDAQEHYQVFGTPPSE